MAGDTRENTTAPSTSLEKSQGVPITPAAPQNANLMPGASLNTAGGKAKEAGFVDAIKAIRWSDFQEIHKKPCVRDAFMTGIGAGFATGGVRAILGATIITSCNWAVGSFCFGSFLMHEYCQRKRHLEMQGMKRAVEVIDRKKREKQMQVEAAAMIAKRNTTEKGPGNPS